MKSKRSQALADKLVDDLLDEKSVKSEKQKRSASPPKKDEEDLTLDYDDKSKGSKPVVPQNDDENATAILSEEEIFSHPSASIPTDDTFRLSDSKIINTDKEIEALQQQPEKKKSSKEVIKAGVGRYAPNRVVGPQSTTEAALARSENLRIAQNRILELEQEVERLRIENEQLAAAGETIRRRADELMGRVESAEARCESIKNLAEEEKQLLQESLEGKERQYQGVQSKIEELESRLSTNIQKIRVRERELENRLELVRMESAALIRSKDELILDLKRQMDQLNMELENYRTKGQELNKSINDKQEMLRRTVKALRLALSMLEGEDEAVVKGQKKAK